MKHFSNINRLQLLKSIWKEIPGFCISVFVTLAHTASNLNSFNHEIKYKKKKRPAKYSREKNSDPQNLDPLITHKGTVALWH